MKFPIIWNDTASVKRAFAYATRTRIAPAPGSRPIDWYQGHTCAALDVLEHAGRQATGSGGAVNATGARTDYYSAPPLNVKCVAGIFYARTDSRFSRWTRVLPATEIYRRADAKARA